MQWGWFEPHTYPTFANYNLKVSFQLGEKGVC